MIDFIKETPVEYRPGRSNQRTIRIRLVPGEIKVSYPPRCSKRRLTAFVDSNRAWIEANLPPAIKYYDGQNLGGDYRLVWRPQSNRNKIDKKKKQLIATSLAPASLEPSLKQLLKLRGEDYLRRRGLQISEELKLKQPQIWTCRYLKSRWGSYSWSPANPVDRITLNLALIHLPQELVDLVIVHELCHLKLGRRGHGRDFWQLLVFHRPAARCQEARLKKYRPSLTPLPPV